MAAPVVRLNKLRRLIGRSLGGEARHFRRCVSVRNARSLAPSERLWRSSRGCSLPNVNSSPTGFSVDKHRLVTCLDGALKGGKARERVHSSRRDERQAENEPLPTLALKGDFCGSIVFPVEGKLPGKTSAG